VTLVQTSVLNAIAVVVRIFVAIGLNKALAVYIGPAGYALVGQFANALTVTGSIAGGAIGSGVTKYTAEYFDAEEKQRLLWRTAARYLVASTSLTALVVLLFSKVLAEWLLGDPSYRSVFAGLALALPLLTSNALLLAIMNGKKEVRAYVAQNIATSILGGAAAAAFAIWFGLTGALFALVINQSMVLFVTLWLCRKAPWLTLDSFIGPIGTDHARHLVGYALMALTSAIAAPLGQVVIRDHLIGRFGQVAAGEWQAVFKMSEVYLQLFTATLSIYFLPRLSEIRDARLLWLEVIKVCPSPC
jgi:PST family polysaccharide transporter